ncbi:hypothetical protein WAF17_08215 [Bernardetia sp. ABR2-2B]|uniref:hypothetical protein n=1 Tax=Bernardetia sp. ABR2-2B TaxID=3127472 RepID=UPI0030CEB29E
MKKSIFSYFSYLVLMLLAVGTLSSCDPTEDPSAAPSITVNPESATIDVGQSVDFTFQVISTESELSEVRIVYPGQADQIATTFTDNNTRYSGVYTFTGLLADASSSVTFTIQATDIAGLTSTKDVVVTINDAPDPIAYASSQAVILAGQDVANTGSFVDMDGTTPTVYLLAAAKQNAAAVDMAYLQGGAAASQGAVIGSPRDASVAAVYNSAVSGVQTWSVQNDTRFRNTALTEDDFEAINDGSLITAAYTNGSEPNIGSTGDIREGSASRVNQLSVGDVFAFRTAGGKDGVAHVSAIETGTTGKITLDVKIVR